MSVTRAIVCRSCPAGRDGLTRALDAALTEAGLRVTVDRVRRWFSVETDSA